MARAPCREQVWVQWVKQLDQSKGLCSMAALGSLLLKPHELSIHPTL